MLKHLFLILVFHSSFVSFSQFKTDSTKRVNFACIPLVNYDPSFGFVFGAIGSGYYNVDKRDTISPVSSTGLFAMATTNKTYFVAAFQRLYLKEDKWRAALGLGMGDIVFQYWQDIPTQGGTFIDFSTKAAFVGGRVERKTYKQLYLQLKGALVRVETTYDVPDYFPDSLRFDSRNLNNIGYGFNYDNREHQLNPYKGFNLEYVNNFYRDWMGNDNNFNMYELIYNQFFKIKNTRNILACRAKASIANGDVPFQAENVVGREDIRGYSSGKYRGNQVYSIQTEYRWNFYKKFGMVAFGGLAWAFDSFDEASNSTTLPGVGAGLRYMMIPKERINIGIDLAVGKHDWGIYFRIAEVFGR